MNFIKKLFSLQFIKFIMVAGLNTLFGYSLFALLLYLNLHYALASFISTVIGVLFNFKTYGTLVFKSNDNLLIIKFIGSYLTTYLIGVGILRIAEINRFSLYITSAITIIPISLITYLLLKYFVYDKIK